MGRLRRADGVIWLWYHKSSTDWGLKIAHEDIDGKDDTDDDTESSSALFSDRAIDSTPNICTWIMHIRQSCGTC